MAPTILSFAGAYVPGYKAGGPIRSLANLVDRLGNDYCFRIVTSDRDLGDRTAYPGIKPNEWLKVGKAMVNYRSPSAMNTRDLAVLLRTTHYDVLYLHSFFSPEFSIKPIFLRGIGVTPKVPVILAPRGEFSPGALAIRPKKKRLFLAMAKASGLYRDVIWQATSELERSHVYSIFGENAHVELAPNLPSASSATDLRAELHKSVGSVKICFLSRITPKKNLIGALHLLAGLKGDIEFNIYGPVEDVDYWQACQAVISSLEPNIHVVQHGPIAHEQVQRVLSSHHAFLFPTYGENYGHVMSEAFLAGCVVVTSDQTPWRHLEKEQVGWDFPLDRPDRFRQVLHELVEMDSSTWRDMAEKSRSYGLRLFGNELAMQQNRSLLRIAGLKTPRLR